MISEPAMELIQQVGQLLFNEANAVMGNRPWSAVVLNVRYDGAGESVQNCLINTEAAPDEPISIKLKEEVNGPLLAMNEHRIDANGKKWEGLSFTITHAGEVKIELAYSPHQSEDATD